MVRLTMLVVVLLAGCTAAHVPDTTCDTPCVTEIPCDGPMQSLRACDIPERGYRNIFCDVTEFPLESLETACVRSCFNRGACPVEDLNDDELVIDVCECGT